MKIQCEKAESARLQGAVGRFCGLRVHHHGACGLRICPRGEEQAPLAALEVGADGSFSLWKAGLFLGGGMLLFWGARCGIRAVRGWLHDGSVRRQTREALRNKAEMREAPPAPRNKAEMREAPPAPR